MSAIPKKQNDKDIFQRLADEKEKKDIFDHLSLNKLELQAKGAKGEVIPLKAIRHIQGVMSCEYDSKQKITDRAESVLTFFVGGEKYFMRAELRLGKPGQCSFHTTHELYILQRRDNFRVRVPKEYQAFLEYKDSDGKLKKITTELFDISAGGCRVRYSEQMPSFSVDQKVELRISLGKTRDAIDVKGEVRHKQDVEADGKKLQVFGVQFVDMKDQFEAKLLNIVIDLHREHFARWRPFDP